jgi:ActR/RegA family two-component response regulator
MKRIATPSTLLFAGDDPAFVELARRFKAQGFIVEQAVDGNLALPQALELKPALVVIDAALRSIPAPRFAQILRTNRQGSDLAIVFVGEEGEEIEGFVRHRDSFFARPLNISQLSAHIEKHFQRLAQAQQLLLQKQEVKGSLDQIGLTDLLQLFGLNGKSGTLFLARGAEHGSVLLQNGQVVNARLGRVDGEKALYRLLLWTSGTFRFSPGAVAGPVKISASTDQLIIEGLRLGDEAVAQAERLPALHSRMQLAIPRERLPQGLRSATREILLKLEAYPRVSDLLDHCPYADLQTLQVLRVLRDKGVISESRDESGTENVPLLAAEEILALHQTLYGPTRIGEFLSAVMVILTPSPRELNEFLPALQVLPGFVPAAPAAVDPLFPGEFGRLQLSESFALRFSVIPAGVEFSPLWSLYARQLFGVIALSPAGTFPAAEKKFAALGAGLLFLDASERQTLTRGNRDDWRELFNRFLPRFQPSPIATEVP